MVLMRIVGLTYSPDHQRAVVVLEEAEQRFRLAFSTDPHEAQRLAREMGLARCSCNPIYDFILSVLCTCQATITRVVLDDAIGKGIGALIYLRQAEQELCFPCYPPDALALAQRAKAPARLAENSQRIVVTSSLASVVRGRKWVHIGNPSSNYPPGRSVISKAPRHECHIT